MAQNPPQYLHWEALHRSCSEPSVPRDPGQFAHWVISTDCSIEQALTFLIYITVNHPLVFQSTVLLVQFFVWKESREELQPFRSTLHCFFPTPAQVIVLCSPELSSTPSPPQLLRTAVLSAEALFKVALYRHFREHHSFAYCFPSVQQWLHAA